MVKEYDENEKRANEIEKSYKYLDGLKRDGYIWEFARRTKIYKKTYERFTELSKTPQPEYDHIAKCLEAARATKIDPIIGVKPPKSNQLATVKFIHYLDDEKTIPSPLHSYYSLPDYHINYRGFTSIPDIGHPVEIVGRHRYRILLGFPEKIDALKYRRNHPEVELPYLFDSRYSKPLKPYHFLSTFLSPGDEAENTIFVGISKKARIDDRERMIKEITPYLSKEKPRKTEKKWKFYLITYDLKQDGCNFPKISNILCMLDKRFRETKNTENSYKAAVELIEREKYKALL